MTRGDSPSYSTQLSEHVLFKIVWNLSSSDVEYGHKFH